jgi:hypothetical protein
MYIDPGSGSLALQIVLAALFSISVGFKLFWRKIKRLVKGQDHNIEAGNGFDN